MQKNPFTYRCTHYKLTNNIRKAIINLLKDPVSSTFIAEKVGVSDQTVLRVLDDIKPKPGNLGKILCIDEFSFKRKRGKTKYGCILINGENNKLIDVLIDRKKETILNFLYQTYGNIEKKVEIFCIDMYETYRMLAKEYNENALVVVDRFHFIKRLNKTLDDIRIRVMKKFKKMIIITSF